MMEVWLVLQKRTLGFVGSESRILYRLDSKFMLLFLKKVLASSQLAEYKSMECQSIEQTADCTGVN